jgi:hypothetical protein
VSGSDALQFERVVEQGSGTLDLLARRDGLGFSGTPWANGNFTS